MDVHTNSYFKKCGKCQKVIDFGHIYQQCSITSCKKLAYCSVDCWEYHNEVMGHKNAYCTEEKAPKNFEPSSDLNGRKILLTPSGKSPTESSNDTDNENDILIVASKLKNFVKNKFDLNTSAEVMDTLSQMVRQICQDAAYRAKADGRKTLMSRDFKF